MTQNISELAKALRDAADSIEKATKFTIGENIDLEDAVKILRAHVPKHDNIYLRLAITIGGDDDRDVSAEWAISESYHEKTKASTLEACMAAYLISKESPDSLASVARLVKTACAVEAEKTQDAIATEPAQA